MRFLFGRFFLPDKRLVSLLRDNRSLMKKYKKFSIFKEDNIFWADEFFNSESFSFATKMSLVESFYMEGPLVAWKNVPQALVSWAYSNALGGMLEDICEFTPVSYNTLAEACSNEHWGYQNLITMCFGIAHSKDGRFEEFKEAAMLLIQHLSSKVLNKTVIIELFKYVDSVEVPNSNMTRLTSQGRERILFRELGLTLKNIVVERVGGDLPYNWAVLLLEEE